MRLTALATLDDVSAAEQLRDLLTVASAETRYGAFRALWTMNADDPQIRGESLGGQFSFHLVDTPAAPMIHVASHRPELVLFGRNQQFTTPLAVNAGNQIMVTSVGDEISVSHFSTHDADQKRTVSTQVEDVIRAIVELGGTYPDVVQALQEAKVSGALSSRFEVECVPGSVGAPDQSTPDTEETKASHPDKGKTTDKKAPADGLSSVDLKIECANRTATGGADIPACPEAG